MKILFAQESKCHFILWKPKDKIIYFEKPILLKKKNVSFPQRILGLSHREKGDRERGYRMISWSLDKTEEKV